MSSEDIMVDGRPLSSLKVTELKEELENRQLSTKGVKAVLQERLKEALTAQGAEPVVDEQNPIVAGYLARQSAALAEARKRTESEASGTTTPQSDLSPTKKSTTSPSKKRTPKKEAKEAEPVPITEEVQEPENSEEVPTKVDDPEVVKESDVPGTVEPSSSSEKESSDEVVKTDNVEEEEKLVESPPKVVEQKEDTNTVEPMEETIKEQEKVSAKQDDDGDELLDYGDDEEKEQKEEEPMDAEDESEKKDEKKKTNEESKDGGVKKEEKVRDEVSRHRRASSPSSRSRHPVSSVVHIRGLTRPFTERQLRSKIEEHGGEIVDFWIDKIKSHCFVKLKSETDAGNVIKEMNETVWPDGNPKVLAIVFETEQRMEDYKEGKETSVLKPGNLRGRAERLSTTSQSSLSLAGKTGLQVTVENDLRFNNKLETKEKRGSLASRLTRIDDKNKEKEKEKETAPTTRDDRKRGRSETPPFSRGAGFMDEKRARHEDSERDRGSSSRSFREEPRRDEHRRDDRRVSEAEIPKKSLEELFKKTVANPPIYYLPLTDEQIAAKANKRMRSSDGERTRRTSDAAERPGRSSGAERSERPDRSEPSTRDRSRGERGRNDRGGDRPRRRD